MDGWFTADHLLAQVDHAIDIFQGLTNGYAQALFLFDNAPSHQKRADDAISAQRMVKGAHLRRSCISCSHQVFPQRRRKIGRIIMADHACVAAHYLPENYSHFTFQNLTPPCPVGSKAWSKSFVNAGCGQKRGCQLSAQSSSAHPTALIAAAGAHSSFNLTS